MPAAQSGLMDFPGKSLMPSHARRMSFTLLQHVVRQDLLKTYEPMPCSFLVRYAREDRRENRSTLTLPRASAVMRFLTDGSKQRLRKPNLGFWKL